MNRVGAVTMAGVMLCWANLAAAQATGNGFLFGPPTGAVTIRGGVDRATAKSDLFAFVTDQLTLTRGDFRAMTLAGEVSVELTPRIGLLVGASFARSSAPSEFRHWLDNRDLAITQTTALMRIPVTAGLKVYLTRPGRSIGRFAWIPARSAFYIGAGGGVMAYRFHQTGDFVDFDTLHVFSDSYNSSGVRPMVQAFGGVDVSLTPRCVLTTDARYQYATARLGTDFAGFDPIDLSGVSMTAGLSFRY